jgi:hypothetical protein
VLGVDWAAVTIAGAFGIGTIVGALLTIRLAKVLADFFRRERDR